MTDFRRYRADYFKTLEGVGIGIVRYGKGWDSQTLEIHSLYVDKPLSNRDIVVSIFQRIAYDLDDGEQALLQLGKYSYRKNWHTAYTGKVNYQHKHFTKGSLYQATLLSHDAVKRKTDIVEAFDEPITFNILEQESEEKNN